MLANNALYFLTGFWCFFEKRTEKVVYGKIRKSNCHFAVFLKLIVQNGRNFGNEYFITLLIHWQNVVQIGKMVALTIDWLRLDWPLLWKCLIDTFGPVGSEAVAERRPISNAMLKMVSHQQLIDRMTNHDYITLVVCGRWSPDWRRWSWAVEIGR
jgi:hypothetical protein